MGDLIQHTMKSYVGFIKARGILDCLAVFLQRVVHAIQIFGTGIGGGFAHQRRLHHDAQFKQVAHATGLPQQLGDHRSDDLHGGVIPWFGHDRTISTPRGDQPLVGQCAQRFTDHGATDAMRAHDFALWRQRVAGGDCAIQDLFFKMGKQPVGRALSGCAGI